MFRLTAARHPQEDLFERGAIDDLDLRPVFTPLTAAIFFANGSAS
jgi:hypothetical protein